MVDSINLYSKDSCPAIDCNALMKLVKEVLELWSSAIELRLERLDSLSVDIDLGKRLLMKQQERMGDQQLG